MPAPAMRIIHNAHTYPSDRGYGRPLAYLEIQRGSTRFPLRPIIDARFLIGSGTNCHLQLGGHYPMLHSLLFQAEEGWVIDAIWPEPALAVNGTPCRRSRLDDGDVVEVAPFRFRLLTAVSEAAEADATPLGCARPAAMTRESA